MPPARLCRWRGQDVRRLPDDKDYPTRPSLLERWPKVHVELFDFLDRQTPQSLSAPLTYRNTRGQEYTLPLGGLMLHVADHSTYHRGQLNSMIKLAGGEPTPVSVQLFLIQRSQACQKGASTP